MATPTENTKPQPMIFAIMRNGHEVIRGDALDVKEKLSEGNVPAAKQLWEDMRKWESLHANMEEGVQDGAKGFFNILDDKCDKIATTNGLFDAHVELETKGGEISKGFEAESAADAILPLYDEFAALNEEHLKKEEAIMMPQVMALKKKGEPLKKIMMEEILPCVSAEDFTFFLEHACRTLEKHSGGMPRARVFVHALWAASTPEEWASRKEIIKAAVSEPIWTEIEGLTS